MSKEKLHCSRIIEDFNPPNLIEKLVHKACESVADAFLGQIEYGRDYIINTELEKDDWADGFGTKYTYTLEFDELVRCKDCKHFGFFDDGEEKDYCGYWGSLAIEPDGFCAWAERMEP